MAEVNTIARPYAVAAFRYARDHGELDSWAEMLEFAAAVASDPGMVALVRDPNVGRQRTTEIFLDVCGDRLSPAGANFVRALAGNGRMLVLEQITELFQSLKREAESRVAERAGAC